MPIDNFIVDFVCLRQRLIVEADGGQHGSERDARRDSYLEGEGFRVLRFWNNDILNNEEGVIETILASLARPSPQPLSRRGERGFSGASHA